MISENDVSAVDSFIKDSGITEMLEPWIRIKTALSEDACRQCKYENEASDMWPCLECCHCRDSNFVQK
jgi:hypothetical protein